MEACRRSLVSLGFFSGTITRLHQILTYPMHSNSTPFGLLFDRGARMRLDYVVRVIGVLHACP